MYQKLDPSQVNQHLQALNQLCPAQPWQIKDGKLHKAYQFKNFKTCFAFMTHVALMAEQLNHHPEWMNVYHQLTIDLITHKVNALTELDFRLATMMEKIEI